MFSMLPLTNLKNQFKSETRLNQVSSFLGEGNEEEGPYLFLMFKGSSNCLMMSDICFILSYLH